MALVTTDRVKENATVTGFGDVVLVGSPAGFQTFSSIMSVGDTCYYSIVDANSGDWETGIGTLTNTNLLERTTVKSSSNNGLMTSFIGGGFKAVTLAFTADQLDQYALTSDLSPYALVANSVSAFNNRTGNVTLTVNDIATLVDTRYMSSTTNVVLLDNNISQSITGNGIFGISSTLGGDAASASWDYSQGLVFSFNDALYVSTLSMYSNQTGLVVENANTGQNINVVLTSTSAELFCNGNYTQTGDSLLTRSMMDTRYLTISSANSTYAVVGHTHEIANVTGLQNALDAKLPSANFTYANITGKPTLANVATSGNYTDLTGTPNLTLYLTTANATATYLPSANFTYANITGKPTLANVATSGNYIDLVGKPALTISGAFDTILTVTANTSVTLPTTGALATLDGSETYTNKTLSTNTTWNGNVITGQYGGTGVANTGKTITIGGNLTTSGAFATTLASTANTSVTLPTTGTLATLDGSETFTNKTLSTNVDYNGNVVTGQYGGTGIANTGKTITIGGNLTTSGAFTTTLTSTANTSITLPITGTLATLAGTESFSNKYITTGAGNTTVAGLVLTSGTNTTAVANGSIEFDNVNYYFSVAGARKVNAYLDSNLTGTWSGTVVAGQYGGTGIANTGKTITIGGNLTTSGAFTTTLTSTANTSVTLPTTGTLATLAGSETFTNKTLSTNVDYNGNVVTGQYGGTGIANTGKTITIGGNLTTSGAFDTTLTATAATSVTLPTAGILATLNDVESLNDKIELAGAAWLWGTNNSALGDNALNTKSSPVQTVTRGTNWKQASCGGSGLFPVSAAIKTDGTLWAWGVNTNGLLGDNTTVSKSSPVQTITRGTNWKQVSVSVSHAAAVKTDGTLWLWGSNAFGNLGDNTGINSSSPVQTITRGTNWKQVSCGGTHTAAIKTDGTLWLWGNNAYAALGDNTPDSKSSPVQTITGGTNWLQVACGRFHTAAIKTDGTLWTWGSNNYSQLGDNTTIARSSPVQTITGGVDWKQVSCGFSHTGAVKTDGTLWTWGTNDSGQLGDNTTIVRSSPVQTITGGVDWKQVTCGYGRTAAVKNDGTLWAWGNNGRGQLGDNTTASKSSPVQTIIGGFRWLSVSIDVHTFAIASDIISGDKGGTGVANTDKTITIGGNFTTSGAFDTTLTSTANTSVILPTTGTLATLAGIESFTNKTMSTNTTWNGSVIPGQYGGTGIANTGRTITIGGNLTTSGAFTTTLTATANTSVTLPTTGTLATLAGIESFTNKTMSTNTTWNGNVITGQYGGTGAANTGKTITIGGNLTTSGAFDTTLTATAATSVTLPTTGTLATLSDIESLNIESTAGIALLWGLNGNGQLGDNTSASKSSPVQSITRGVNWKQASCGGSHSAAIKTDGTLWLWGRNSSGFLADNTIVDRSSPVQTIAGGVNWKQVSVSRSKEGIIAHTAAIKTDGTLWLWGTNTSGQLGDNTTGHKSSPVQTIAGGTNWSQVSCGEYHTAAIKTDGTLWAWGENGVNEYGQLGDNTVVNRSSPVQTIAGGTNWSQVSCGEYHTAAIKTDGTLWVWGYNNWGTLGTGDSSRRSSPVQTIAGGTNWSQVASGGKFTAAIKTDGTLWTWGIGFGGQLGTNSTNSTSSPGQTTTGGTNWKQVTCGYDQTAAIKTDGSLWLWGENAYGSGVLGDNTTVNKSSPVQTITRGYRWLSVSIGRHAFAIAADIISGDKGGTGVANTDKTITIGGNLTTSGAFTTTLTSTANTSVILPTTGTLATLAGTETFSNKTVNLAAGNATTAPLKFVTGTNMTTAAAGNMEFNGTRLFFTPSTTRQTVAFLTDITGGLTVADDTTTNATRYLIFTNTTSGSVSTANTSSSKLYFNPSTGDLTAGGSITALSDRALKNNITTITGAVDKVNNMRGVEFDWIESGGHGIGMIAQEVEDVIPEVVLTHKGLKSVAYGNLIAVLIEAIKDQDKRIKLLEALVERLVK